MARKSITTAAAPRGATSEDKLRAIEAAQLQIEKQFGQGSLMKLGSRTSIAGIETIPSGSVLLDEALGLGGYPKGRVVEIYGPESSGKTTLALHAIAEAQKKGGIAAFIDAEHALDPIYARNLGVNIDELWVSQPDTGEQALEITESLVRSGAVDMIVVDSVAALTPQAEIDGDMGDSHVGLQARLMSQALRKLTGTISKSGACLIFINQIRMKIGVMFGNPETTTGGKALKFYSSVRLEVRRIETISQGTDNAIGNKVRVKVVKNKIAPPFRKVEMEIMFGKGISASGSLLDAALKYDLVQKSGSWYSYGDERIGQGRENAKLFIETHDEIGRTLDTQVRDKMFAHLRPEEPAPTSKSEAAKDGAVKNEAAEDDVPAAGGSSKRGAAPSRDAAAAGNRPDVTVDAGSRVPASDAIEESPKVADDELF